MPLRFGGSRVGHGAALTRLLLPVGVGFRLQPSLLLPPGGVVLPSEDSVLLAQSESVYHQADTGVTT